MTIALVGEIEGLPAPSHFQIFQEFRYIDVLKRFGRGSPLIYILKSSKNVILWKGYIKLLWIIIPVLKHTQNAFYTHWRLSLISCMDPSKEL